MSDSLPYLIIVTGPTASGKTALAIALAKHYESVVLSADSRQFYKGMAIGTAQPNEAELASVKHYFIADRNVDSPVNAGSYADEALALLDTLFQQHKVVIVCGGTGLYIRALIDGLDNFPDIPENYREELSKELAKDGLEKLLKELTEKDPSYANQVDPHNPHRILRALEVIRFTKQPYSSFLQQKPQPRNFKAIQIAIDLDREVLYDRINQRVEQMMADGLEEEVLALKDHFHLNALQTVGYKEWLEYFDGSIDSNKLVENIQQHSRNYAKRQITWFKRDARVHWIKGADVAQAITICNHLMQAHEH
ncbi:MAG: tRNA (adenosine(37)-N6)-dimethylallyltransferase MiaA [Chitinophagales bacterium]|nr:tRNA (adenosine(37)-N6)-dimethylallyltransferase MiaA [Chitinophagales bacterium]